MRGAAACGLLLAAALAMGCYNPSPVTGTLMCGTDLQCPQEYRCSDGSFCYKHDGTASYPFLGRWGFAGGSSQDIECTDGSSSASPITDDYVDVINDSGVFTGDYYCVWKLTLGGATPKFSLASAGQTCATTNSKTGTMFVWTGVTFDFLTTDGAKATLNGNIAAAYKDTMGATGTCTLRITGVLQHK